MAQEEVDECELEVLKINFAPSSCINSVTISTLDIDSEQGIQYKLVKLLSLNTIEIENINTLI